MTWFLVSLNAKLGFKVSFMFSDGQTTPTSANIAGPAEAQSQSHISTFNFNCFLVFTEDSSDNEIT